MSTRSLTAALTVLLLLAFTAGCSSQNKADAANTAEPPAPLSAQPTGQPEPAPPTLGLIPVTLETNYGTIRIELDGDNAPISVANFLAYLDAGAYDNTIFHRVVPGFVVQGGGHAPDLSELPSGPPIKNEWQNGLANTRGTIAMARESDPDSATRQFYINLANNARLDTARALTGNAGYAVFGRVTEGMDVLDRIARVPTTTAGDMANVPIEPVRLIAAQRADEPRPPQIAPPRALFRREPPE
jgi:peptidyl-prolyl cis-trans isomerase A (cyclophilin A)